MQHSINTGQTLVKQWSKTRPSPTTNHARSPLGQEGGMRAAKGRGVGGVRAAKGCVCVHACRLAVSSRISTGQILVNHWSMGGMRVPLGRLVEYQLAGPPRHERVQLLALQPLLQHRCRARTHARTHTRTRTRTHTHARARARTHTRTRTHTHTRTRTRTHTRVMASRLPA